MTRPIHPRSWRRRRDGLRMWLDAARAAARLAAVIREGRELHETAVRGEARAGDSVRREAQVLP